MQQYPKPTTYFLFFFLTFFSGSQNLVLRLEQETLSLLHSWAPSTKGHNNKNLGAIPHRIPFAASCDRCGGFLAGSISENGRAS